jgi:hypothetical protein
MINKEINEHRVKKDNIKKEATQDMENHRKKMKQNCKTKCRANTAE